jgi:predicted ferric reductase
MNKFLEKLGWPIIFILSFLPALMWAFEAPIIKRFSNLDIFTTSLGQLTGLVGMTMFALSLLLSARAKFLEKFFSGINQVYLAHHFFGALSFCLLLFHPILLVYSYLATSFQAGVIFLIPSTEYIARTYGTIGLILMIVPLFITFYTKLKYQIWKFTHKFLGLAFIFAFFHTFTIGSDVSRNPTLKYYIFILSVVGFVVYIYRSILNKFLVFKYEYTIKNIQKLGDMSWELEFEPKSEAINYLPGQFVFLKIYNENLSSETHPFSISSANNQNIKIIIKELGDYTKNIGLVKVGDRAEIEGPYGKFNSKNYGKNQIWIAGGVGITPFLSMLRALDTMGKDHVIDLYYSVISESALICKEEIEKIKQNNPNLNVKFWITEKEGYISPKYILENSSNAKNRDILICGPSAMMTALKNGFIKQGFAKEKIITEDFKFY